MQEVKIFLEKFRNPRYYWVSGLLAALFPFITVLNTEFNHMQDTARLWEFITQNTGIFVFDLVYIAVLFLAMLLLVRRTFWAGFLISAPLYILSCVEFFKFTASNTHFVISDLLMTANAKDVAGLATLTFTPELILCAVVFVVFNLLMWLFDYRLKILHRRVSSILAALVLVCNVGVIISPTVARAIFTMAGIQDRGSTSSFVINEEFHKNNFIASLVKNSEKEVQDNILEPEEYSQERILKMGEGLPASGEEPELKPNVIVVMSESYSDMRRLQAMDEKGVVEVPASAYQTFDRLAQEGTLLECVVPTFGGYTTRTEFELTMGLPVNSMNNLTVPHFKLKERPQLSVAESFRSDGYRTYYVHPFSGSFYGREEVLSTYGFDRLIFQEDGWPETMEEGSEYEKYRRYIDDGQVFSKIIKTLKNEEQPVYLHATTMQNHQPYSDETGTDQLEYYLHGIQHTDEELAAFTQALQELDEPTVLLFVGDHYPFFVGEESVYNQLGINSRNCADLYVQPYLLWSTYGQQWDQFPQEKVSAFYLPHVLRRQLGLTLDPWEEILLKEMEETPIYTQAYENGPPNQVLDELTFDMTVGEQYVAELVS
ncbi:MAG: LTA synthase family protein [Eubacteriales bacterium]|jgi:phosphoglycerol transferase MdoB-like AlkP superfamily enzyme